MNSQIGAPGKGVSRRQFLAATDGIGAASLAGCTAPTDAGGLDTNFAQTDSNRLPLTGKPEVVNLDELGGKVTVKSVKARHDVHPHDMMGGPISLPVVWAFQANDGTPSVPGPILRVTEGRKMEVTFDNTEMEKPHTFHVHGLRKTWENDDVPTTTAIQVDLGETHTYEFEANVPGTHLYHCHYNTPWHMEMGMYGVLRVDPEGYEEADKEYFTTVEEWDTRLSRQYGGENVTYDLTNRRPDAFTVNGRAAPYTLHPEEERSATTKRASRLLPVMTDWTEKYRPTTKSEVRGNNEARDALWEWAETWDDHREAVVLHGSPGVGKTSAAHALASDKGWETIELNASDQRTADVIERFAGRAAKNATLAGAADASTKGRADRGRQLVIVDEADNIHGNYDRGGSGAITSLVKESNQPIVLIANEYYDMSRGLRNATRDIEFRDVSARSIVPVLRNICRQEDVEFDDEALETVAEANSGDLRSAVNDLQAAADGRRRLTVDNVVTGDRDRTVGIFDFLDRVLKEEAARDALQSAYAVDETPDDLTKWVEGNIAKVYEGDELARGYDHLANADRWLGRVRATQDYSYWRYATDNLAAGVAAAREGSKGGWTRFGRPQFWPSSDATADEVVRRVAESGGFSMATARRQVLPFLAAMTHHCKPRDLTVAMAAYYDLDESHVSFVTGSGETTNKVESIVEDAQAMRDEEMESHAGGAFAPGAGGEDTDGSEDADASEGSDASDGESQATLDGENEGAPGDDGAADSNDPDDDSGTDGDQSGLSDFV